MNKLISVLQAQVTRFLLPQNMFGYMPPVIDAIQRRYVFVGAPITTGELFPADANKGALFKHGSFGNIVVDNLQLFHLGLVANTLSCTDDTELFLDDLVKWFAADFKITFDTIRPQVYWSQLEFQYGEPLAEYFPDLKKVGFELPGLLGEFWPAAPPFEITSLTLSCDPNKVPAPAPAGLKIERRQGVPYEQNLYISEAQLRTRDHLRILESLFAK
jgi:hypothetical protein